MVLEIIVTVLLLVGVAVFVLVRKRQGQESGPTIPKEDLPPHRRLPNTSEESSVLEEK